MPATDAGEPAPLPSAAEAALDVEAGPRPSLERDAPALIGMAFLYLASIGLSLAFSFSFISQHVQAFQDPQSLANPLIYLVIVVVFTLVILAIAKWGKRIIIKYIILASVLMTVYYVANYVAGPLFGSLLTRDGFPLGVGTTGLLAALLGVGVTALLWFYPEWYVIDIAGIVVAAGAAGIFGISFGLLPAVLLLVAFAIYDAIAVYRTKHMLDLADSVLELRLPIMFVVPKSRGYSFLAETRKVKDPNDKAPREAMFMGLGDAVFPAILVVSSFVFLNPAGYDPGKAPSWVLGAADVAGIAPWVVVSMATLLGSFLGFWILMYFVMKGRPHAGLPLLNGGALLGFFLTTLPLYGLAPLNPF